MSDAPHWQPDGWPWAIPVSRWLWIVLPAIVAAMVVVLVDNRAKVSA